MIIIIIKYHASLSKHAVSVCLSPSLPLSLSHSCARASDLSFDRFLEYMRPKLPEKYDGDLGSVEFLFIAITPWHTLT